MQPLAIVPAFDVLEDDRASFSFGLELDRCAFCFQGGKEAFCNCVVIAVSVAAHADLASKVGQLLALPFTGVLAAPVRVMQQTCFGLAVEQRHLPGAFHQTRLQRLSHRPAHHAARVQIQDGSQI